MPSWRSVLFLSAVTFAVVAQADVPLIPIEEDYKPPVAISEELPKYPKGTRANLTEGWVLVQFEVGADGQTRDIRIIERSIANLFDTAAIEAVQKWRYEPATLEGVPVSSTQYTRLFFHYEDMTNTVSRTFLRHTRDISHATAKGDLESAWKKIEKLESKTQRKMAESTFLPLLKSMYFQKAGDSAEALKQINLALRVADFAVSKASYEDLLRHAIALNLEAGLLGDAQRRYNELVESRRGLAENDPARVFGERIEALASSPDILQHRLRLERCEQCDDPDRLRYHHTLARQRFVVDEISGSALSGSLNCGSRSVEFNVQVNTVYSFPPPLNYCVVTFFGDSATGFRLSELPYRAVWGSL